ncbi:fungal-specific transcription factor domain-containing protein [Ilyonectria sp. MPI-CAGE-AT-0026]|nr:fungal-specific transcription factor domain-containing protein [Ilyonectria sp. MPI-CAGE-AT-0026]
MTNRLERLENILSQAIVPRSAVQPDASATCTSNRVHSTSTNPSTTIYAGLLLCQSRHHSGIPFFTQEDEEWIFSRTGEKSDFRKLTANHKNQQTLLRTLSHLPIQEAANQVCALPPRGVVQACLDAFHQSAFRLIFPVIDYALFQESIAVTYESTDEIPPQRHTTATACVLAFLSMMALFHGELSFLPPVDWDACCDMVQSLLVHTFDEVSLETLQTTLMLYLRQRFFGLSESAAMYHAIACRMAFTLGGHLNSDIKSFGDALTRQDRETRHIRLLFWNCYIFDNDIALRTGQPPLISDSHCDLTLPEGYVENHFNPPLPGDHLSSSLYADESLVPFLPGELRLSKLKHKTYQLLYSAQALTRPKAEVIRAILELDDELESWRLSIPEDFRPALSISDPKHPVPDLKLQQQMQHSALHLEYHHLMVKIHQASTRCIAKDPDASHNESEGHAGIKTSMALCLEASRSTLFYLRAVTDRLAGEAFWIIVFYPTAAMMTLFLHILAEPLAPLARSDLELLSSAVDLINSIPIRRLTLYEIGHIQLVNDFITELVRLGNCVIYQAMMK